VLRGRVVGGRMRVRQAGASGWERGTSGGGGLGHLGRAGVAGLPSVDDLRQSQPSSGPVPAPSGVPQARKRLLELAAGVEQPRADGGRRRADQLGDFP
jgi:hypothetical protein